MKTSFEKIPPLGDDQFHDSHVIHHQNSIHSHSSLRSGSIANCGHTRAHGGAQILKDLELDAGFMIPGHIQDTSDAELIQYRPKHNLQAVVSNNGYFSGCYDGTLNTVYVIHRRNLLVSTCNEARMVVWEC